MTFLLHNIGPKLNENYNTREEIAAAKGLLTFDGVYLNVWENRDLLRGREVILFVTGDYVGKDNSFDVGMPREKFCDWNQIMQIVNETGAKIGWHSWSHGDMTKMSLAEIEMELTPPFPMEDFAYPHGRYDQGIAEMARKAGYKRAWSVTQGDGGPYSLRREYL